MKILIVGGGMSGLCYGILCARKGRDVLICEKNARVGKKISVTGNGRCNLGNQNVSERFYNDGAVVKRVLNTVSVAEYLEFLRQCGIITFTDGAGRIYPLCECAPAVAECLRYAYERSGGKTQCNCAVTDVRKQNDGFTANCGGRTLSFDEVVVCCGSGSGCDSPVVDEGLKKYFTPLVPSLVPVKVKGMDKTLNGIRQKGVVTLYSDGKPVATERGEVQFKEYGLSGICIFNLSAVIARDKVKGIVHDYKFVLDAFPDFSQSRLADVLRSRSGWERDKLFYGLLHNKVAQHLLKIGSDADELAFAAKNMSFTCEKLLDYSMSQVTAGGVADNFVDEKLRLPNGVRVLGEALNADGLCGGYNLFFAAASAIYASDGGRE